MSTDVFRFEIRTREGRSVEVGLEYLPADQRPLRLHKNFCLQLVVEAYERAPPERRGECGELQALLELRNGKQVPITAAEYEALREMSRARRTDVTYAGRRVAAFGRRGDAYHVSLPADYCGFFKRSEELVDEVALEAEGAPVPARDGVFSIAASQLRRATLRFSVSDPRCLNHLEPGDRWESTLYDFTEHLPAEERQKVDAEYRQQRAEHERRQRELREELAHLDAEVDEERDAWPVPTWLLAVDTSFLRPPVTKLVINPTAAFELLDAAASPCRQWDCAHLHGKEGLLRALGHEPFLVGLYRASALFVPVGDAVKPVYLHGVEDGALRLVRVADSLEGFYAILRSILAIYPGFGSLFVADDAPTRAARGLLLDEIRSHNPGSSLAFWDAVLFRSLL